MSRPDEPSSTVRRRAVHVAQDTLEQYQRFAAADPSPTEAQVARLLLAMADLERALWWESNGRYGTEHSTSRDLRHRYESEGR